ITAGWNGQPMQEDANKLVVNAVTGKNLTASQITAAIESQEFNSIGTSTVDDSNFKFTKPDHFIALSSGLLSIDIINQIDLGIENLEISFPDIRNSSTDAPLVMNMNHIPSASAGGQFSASQDLSGYRIYATGNEIDYNIHAVTENTQQGTGSEKVTIRQDDKLQAMVEINNLEIAKAKGVIIPRTVLLNDDEAADEKLDVFNGREAEVINIDGISDLSEQISDITFANPVLSMIYETNLTAHATIYAAIAGVNADGKTVYLSGKPGGKYYVSQAEIPSELRAKGRALDENQLIQFRIEPSGDGSTISRSVEFDSTGTNASGFFSNLPSEIHFVGIARINEDGGAETISTPITFDSRLSVDLPLYFSAQNATFTDTLEADLSDLPGKSDDQQLTQATFTINYTNGLPFGLDLSLIFMNENGDEITSYPLNGQNPVSVQAASVNPTTGFVEEDGGQAGKFQLSLTEDQLKIINQTRSIMLKINFDTSRGKEVKVRAEDSITLRLKMSVDMTSTVN
ncbi:MAG TPA: hypothetical protein VFG39_00765, partial [Balneolaceae bacterium]|nr:hypothetical protein [Balneolaceae bacterium]